MSDESIANDVMRTVGTVRPGATFWGTFEWFGKAVYLVCWMVALPAELLLNRRMGRRYSGMLPVFVGFLVWQVIGGVGILLVHGTGLAAVANRPVSAVSALDVARAVTMSFVPVVVYVLAVYRHRLASWWRFRTGDQVHSFSNGVPFWLHPPVLVTRRLGPERSAPAPAKAPPLAVPQNGLDAAVLFLRELRAHLLREWPGFVRSWRSGEVPTGVLAWLGSTVVHPLLVILGGIALMTLEPGLGFCFVVAGGAIFVKARIQKASVVESVYNLFDARIEQDFTRALSNPERMRAVETTGYGVPGLARTLVESGAVQLSRRTALAPELGKLVDAAQGPVVVATVPGENGAAAAPPR